MTLSMAAAPKRVVLITFLIAGLLYLFSTRPPHPQASAAITDFVVFGDSYSDSCNLWRFTRDNVPPYEYLWPACPPAPRGRHSTNRTWPEWAELQFGSVDEKTTTTSNASSSSQHRTSLSSSKLSFHNFAVAGAVCDAGEKMPREFDVTRQIDYYLGSRQLQSKSPADFASLESTAVVLFVGTNDLIYMAHRAGTPKQAAACVVRQVDRLRSIGFRKFVVFENVNLGVSPRARKEGKPELFSNLALENNARQRRGLQELFHKDKTSELLFFPTFDLFTDMHNLNPKYGFHNSSGIYVHEREAGRSGKGFMWLDNLHPSDAAQRIIASEFLHLVQGWTSSR